MADKIRVNVLKQKVFHDGMSMIVLNPGSGKVDPAHLQTLFDEGIIADPGKEALRRAAALSGFTDAGELKGPGDDTFSQPIGAFTEEQERNLAEQSQLLAGDEDDDVEALRERIAELEGEGGELSILRARVTELETERDDLLAELTEADEKIAALSKLDLDGDGKPGGSTAQTGDELHDLRAEYEALAGKKVFNGWDAEALRAKIVELKAGNEGEAEDQDGSDDAEGEAPPA